MSQMINSIGEPAVSQANARLKENNFWRETVNKKNYTVLQWYWKVCYKGQYILIH